MILYTLQLKPIAYYPSPQTNSDKTVKLSYLYTTNFNPYHYQVQVIIALLLGIWPSQLHENLIQ